MLDARNDIVNWAKWGVTNNSKFIYTEDSRRMQDVRNPNANPIYCDCSAFVTYCYSWAGVNQDPNGQNYDGQGYTGTLLSHGTPITVSQAIPGDVIVYGPGTGDHTALIIEAGPDPLTVSMGEQGDPSYVRVSQDGRQPQRYLRFNTSKTGPSPTPPTPTPPAPTQHIIVPGVTVQMVQAKIGVSQDGIWGPQTENAVRNFQSSHGLQVDGIVGPVTWASMNSNPSKPTIQQGSQGPAVITLQQHLGIPADGIFGPQTENAVRNFQSSHGLQVDGIVGPQTWRALGF